MNKHHIIPRSRKKKRNKTVNIPKGFHRAFHEVFGNLYGNELILFVKEFNILLETKDTISGEDIENIKNSVRGLDLYEFHR